MKRYPLADALWAHTAPAPPATHVLQGGARADVLVIGGGYTGLSCALHLAQAGADVVLLEAEEIGHGGSGRNAGHCNPTFIRHSPQRVIEILGPVHGPRMVELQTRAADLVFGLIREHRIECEAEQSGVITAAHAPGSVPTLEDKHRQYAPYHRDARLLDAAEVAELTGSERYHAGWLVPSGGHLNPLGYARGLARAALDAGARLFTGSPVQALERVDGKWCARTPSGAVHAERVVVGTNAYTNGDAGSGAFLPGLDRTFYRIVAYNVASDPLSENLRRSVVPRGNNVIDTRGHTHYYKLDRDGRLVTGSVLGWRRGRDPALTRDVFRRRMGWIFPQLGDVDWPWMWHGHLAVSLSTLPSIYDVAPGVVAVLGYSGRGVPTATAMGCEIARWLGGAATDSLVLPVRPPQTMRSRHALSALVPLILGPLSRWHDARSMRRHGLEAPQL